MKRKTKSRIAITIALLASIAALAIGGFLLYGRLAAHTAPSPDATLLGFITVSDEAETDDDGFPEVDWSYWQGVNADVIGWITVPGTDIDSPILQAHADDPEHYLHYDVYGNYNPRGAIYLDAECEEYGLSSRNAVILGHHYGYSSAAAPFGIIAEYSDEDFAAEHVTVLIQTPASKMTYEVRFAQIVKGWEPNKRTSFDSEQDYRQWYDGSRDEAAMVLDAETEPKQTISLVSCSYNYWSWNERTVVVTSAQESASAAAENGEIPPDAS